MPASPLGWIEAPTVIDAINALMKLCDGATSKDGKGFSRYDREKYGELIDAAAAGFLSQKQEDLAYKLVYKYRKQLKLLGIAYEHIGHIPRTETTEDDGSDDAPSVTLVKIALAAGMLWHTSQKIAYITFERGNHLENHPVKSREVKLWLTTQFYHDNDAVPQGYHVTDAIATLEGIAIFEGPEYEVFIRVALYKDRIYVDLGDETWKAIEISKAGWLIVDKPPIRFYRPKNMLPLPMPTKDGDWTELRKIINAGEDRTWILLVGWATQAFWPTGPYAHFNFNGEQGTGKTIAQIIFKYLIDPSAAPLRRPPESEKDLMIVANHEHVPSFDNLSGMPEKLSDAMCGLSSGVALATRALYTDNEESLFTARRPCLMNGIDTLTNRGDLLDRTLVADLPRIQEKQRKMEKKIMARFEEIRPGILGLLLDATVEGLKNIDTIDVDSLGLPRMADFAAWVVACEPALPWWDAEKKQGRFLVEYKASIKSALGDLVDGDQVAKAIFELAFDARRLNRTHTGLMAGSASTSPTEELLAFSGSASELLDLLNARRGISPTNPPQGWPRIANFLSARIRRMAPALLARGVRVEICKKDRGTRLVRIICEVGEIEEDLTFHSTEQDPKTKTATSESSPDKTLCFDPDTKNPGDDGDDQKKSSSPKNRYQSMSGDDETMETMNPQKSMPNSKNENIKKGYLKIGEKIVSIVSSSPDVSAYRFSGDDQIKSSSPIPPVIVSEDPGFKKFQAKMERRVCELCGYRSPHDLGTWFYHGATHYTCTTCRMGAVPAEKPMCVAEVGQKTLEGGD